MSDVTSRQPLPLASRRLLPVATGAELRAWIAGVAYGRRRVAIVAAVALIADSVLGLVGPIAIGWITQAVVDQRPVNALIGPGVLLLAAALATALSGWTAAVLLARLVMPVVGELREQAVGAITRLPLETVEASGDGDLVSRVSGDTELVTDTAGGAIGSFIGAALSILATLAGLAVLDWRFALAGLLAVPIQAQTLRWYLRTARPIYAAGRIADGRRTSALLTGFTMLPTLRTLRLSPRQRDSIAAASEESMAIEFQANRTATRFFGRLNFAEFIGLGAILLVAFFLVRSQLATVGAATTAALFFAALFNPINIVLGVFDTIQQAAAGLGRLVGLIKAAGPVDDDADDIEGGSGARPGLEAADVTFGYDAGPDVLRDVSVRLEPGGQVAVVGTTGSGKSTLATLLAGQRIPRSGSVTLDGRALSGRALSGRALSGSADGRPDVVMVTQETHLFAGSVADNLRLGNPQASIDDLSAALAAVGADAWVAALPDGLDTEVGGDGRLLTANQAQHLALARILLIDPRYVVLDEATAESGSDTARLLDQASRAVVRGRGALVIAHRLPQAADADLILVMENGRVIERGSHSELVRRPGGAYSTLWQAWAQPNS